MTPEQLARSGTEDGHQAALFCWAQQNVARLPGVDFMFAVPNGGARDARVGARLKMTGVKPGVPDIFLPLPKGRHAGMFIEMKKPGDREKKKAAGRTSSKQDVYIEFLQSQHYHVVICFSWEDAAAAIELYYTGQA